MPTLQIASYDVAIDLTGGPDTFWSRTEIHFGCTEPGVGAAADVYALNIWRAVLNGADLQDAVFAVTAHALPPVAGLLDANP